MSTPRGPRSGGRSGGRDGGRTGGGRDGGRTGGGRSSGGSGGRDGARDGGRSHGRSGTPSRGRPGSDAPPRTTGPTTPGPQGPHGIESATRTPGAPPRTPRGGPRGGSSGSGRTARPPAFPDGLEIALPKGVARELRQVLKDREQESVGKALTYGAMLIDEGDGETAVPYLAYAKEVAPRVATIREALGIACYLAERYKEALAELQAYRRLTGKVDQNHVIADCQRALGRPTAKVGETVQEMDPEDVGPERYAEGIIVWASALADGGDVAAGRAVLRRLLGGSRPRKPSEADLRLWYVAGDLAERDGDAAAARRWFAAIGEHDDDFHDVPDRLAAL